MCVNACACVRACVRACVMRECAYAVRACVNARMRGVRACKASHRCGCWYNFVTVRLRRPRLKSYLRSPRRADVHALCGCVRAFNRSPTFRLVMSRNEIIATCVTNFETSAVGYLVASRCVHWNRNA
ncbi:hypothetical protein EVAR_77887_1 [Eumeta japonica]|uniref:Uncharacterized protein n=1 Tax=Eumeta variegata TaxID=151549 RepID=A0A4C1TBG8_EUMVA|nr:hypothetical protein EVAR_77887_1 [Eumeta japonica]